MAPWKHPTRSIRFERLTVEDGLSQGTVICIVQNRDGFLWLGTQYGLNRFDGYGFEVYKHDPDDPVSLPADCTETHAQYPPGALPIGSEGQCRAR